MSVFGAAIAQSVVGMSQSQRAAAQKAERKRATQPDGKPREADEVILDIQSAQSPDAVHSPKGNGDEETAEDRQHQDHYQTAQAKDAKARPRLDVQG